MVCLLVGHAYFPLDHSPSHFDSSFLLIGSASPPGGHRRIRSFASPVPEFQITEFSDDDMREETSTNETGAEWSQGLLVKTDSEEFLSLSQGNVHGE